ncbi:glycoside hydrolase family 26 protein [Spirosoma telluris]|uniref:glycoside hydrolase family 26 protein n=1 Tax=Spirosoma telluris TaxID=2183553 RepID=UPI002FC2B153
MEPSLTDTSTHLHRSEAELQSFLDKLKQGHYNVDLQKLVKEIKRYKEPVLLSFAPEFDDTTQVWGTKQEKTLIRYEQAWQYLVKFTQQQHVNNIIWVWCPTQSSTLVSYYPGSEYVDWLGFKIVNNPVLDEDHQTHSFAALYQLLHNTVRLHFSYTIREKPILITRFGSITPAGKEQEWVREAVSIINERYPEIRGIVLNPQQAKVIQ